MEQGWLRMGRLGRLALAVLVLGAAAAHTGETMQTPPVPAEWLAAWKRPPAADRPLQIVHGIDPARADMRFYQGLGLGGVVCNVSFRDYMRSEEAFKVLASGVEACARLGLVVWLYDEDGYPSGAAGGLVLKEDPACEAQALAFDAAQPEPFLIRPAYEHTHASNNYYAARRYINLLDERATRSFIAHTHEVYWQRLAPHFGKTIQAFFTDEPSLIAVNLGQLPEEVRKKVRVVDAVNPAIPALPTAPWSRDLAEQYQKRHGEDLLTQRRSLFTGDTPQDQKVRRQFWALVADLVTERYFGALQDWCAKHRVASSGHILWEEGLTHHAALDGNHLKALSRMDIPGLDMLSSDPEAVIHSGWLTAALPSSAALLTGRRRVMTEVSDFSQKMGGRGPAALQDMQAAAAWQAAWGVTDFTLYYGTEDRPAEDYRAYCEYVGRLNAALKPARWAPEVLLYYHVYDLWAEYRPVAEPLKLESQSARARSLVGSFQRLGQTLQRKQVPFALVDHEFLAAARPEADGTLVIKDQRFKALLLPEGTELPAGAARVVEEFRAKGGRVLVDGPDGEKLTSQALIGALKPAHVLTPASERIALGQFVRDGRRILVVVNVGTGGYAGQVTAEDAGTWVNLHPATGAIEPAATAGPSAIRVSLAGRQAVLLVKGR